MEGIPGNETGQVHANFLKIQGVHPTANQHVLPLHFTETSKWFCQSETY